MTARTPGARTAVAVSPHLDDAVFSAGGVLAALARAGWSVRVVTCFTASVEDPCAFALSTQLDKGLPAETDYMALRRAEDTTAQRMLGVLPPVHLPLPEAPHRGYGSAPELFASPRADDMAGAELESLIRPHLAPADLVLAPRGIGGHVDHLITAWAVAAAAPPSHTCWWRDVPYVIRAPYSAGRPPPGRSADATEVTVDIGTVLTPKIAAAACYTSQLGFQFGGVERVGGVLSAAARTEARRTGARCGHGEALRVGSRARRLLNTLFPECPGKSRHAR
ncbi:PIG-L deacetylase family protein [Streptomyces sp. CNQ085]|uniref:PIG-L deacetylase family protein n=1 Tax=Streptomyces sp. CNQ085 TaxID=2886944 RepID=UPI001F510F48|nr:PIG-L family deacetylase [Streptomyces sp. CNQ085]MCI0384342.1 PIG-L family deacetylase [Streptomyces sp. CNQ085]